MRRVTSRMSAPGPHIGVIHLSQHGGELLAGLLHGILRAAAGVQYLFHHRGVVLILHEHGVGLKENGGLVACLSPGSLGHLLQLGHGLLLGLLQTGKLRLLVLGGPADGAQLDPLIKIKGAVLNAFGDALSL